MPSYVVRDVQKDELDAFRRRCHENGLKPADVLKRFIADMRIEYMIQSDSIHVCAPRYRVSEA